MDDYLEDFDDFDDEKVVPEACVNDVIRCRVIGATDADIVELQRRLHNEGRSRTVTIRDKGKTQEFTLTLIRAKNKFNLSALSPTHFRCILNNLKLEHQDGRTLMVEAQVR